MPRIDRSPCRFAWGWLLFGAFSAFMSSAFADLRVVGTDLLGLEFTKACYEFAGRNGMKLALAFDGSRPGLAELTVGRADLALVILPAEEESVALASFRTIPLAYHRIVVLVPLGCPLQKITVAELATVFGAPETIAGGNAMRWQELGATGEWASDVITPILPQASAGITAEYFRHVVLRERAWRGNILRFTDAAELKGHFAGNSRAMALASAGPPGAINIKPIPVSSDIGQPASLGTSETLHAGTYPLRLAMRLVFRPERETALRVLFRFLFSDDAARLVETAGFVPLPTTVRTNQLDMRP